ncbi:glyoxalase [Microbacterium sp.]|uniref:glyoxalase n=1 Tax=Microbacterium sp. TaxID=51671 RepID=UPI0028A58A2A|nr:glyoxalase [Microbacterium sp.]
MSVGLHHVELWLADGISASGWPWLLEQVGFVRTQSWEGGESWSAGGAYLTLTTSPTLSSVQHDRRRAGMNHLAFHGGSPSDVDALMEAAQPHGWRPLYADRYPHAGGDAHYAGWLENAAGFKVEVVAQQE